MEAGILPDSSTVSRPVAHYDETRDGSHRSVSEFADDSRRSVSQEIPDQPAERGVSGCKTSGVWKVGCKVEIRDVMSSARFTIDYYPSPTTKSKVREFRGATCAIGMGSCSLRNPKGISRAAQSSAGAAWARLSYVADMWPLHAEGEFGIRVGSKGSVKTY
jgi:hypothetical protein